MSDAPDVFAVIVTAVEEFPGRDDLNVNRLSNGATCVSNREVAGGPSRYQPGDLVIHVPEGLIAPDWLMQRQGVWDDVKGKGKLGGNKGNRTKNRTFKVDGQETGILSEGMLLALERVPGSGMFYRDLPTADGVTDLRVREGDDLKAALGLLDPAT